MTKLLILFALATIQLLIMFRYRCWSNPRPLNDNMRAVESIKRMGMVGLVLGWLACLVLLCAEIRGD